MSTVWVQQQAGVQKYMKYSKAGNNLQKQK